MSKDIDVVYSSFLNEARDSDGKVEYPVSHIQRLLRLRYEEAVLVLQVMIDRKDLVVISKTLVVFTDKNVG